MAPMHCVLHFVRLLLARQIRFDINRSMVIVIFAINYGMRARYVLMNIGTIHLPAQQKTDVTSCLADRYIFSRLQTNHRIQ